MIEPNYDLIRPEIMRALKDYGEKHRATGGFLRSVLENDLMQAFGRADEDNVVALFHIVNYIYNEMPSRCWGSREAVDAWLKEKT